jgi:hypothetical protein
MKLLMFLIGILIPTIFYAQLTEIKYSKSFKVGAFYTNTSYYDESKSLIVAGGKIFHHLNVNNLKIGRTDLTCMEDVGYAMTYTPTFFLYLEDKVFYIFTGRKGSSKKERKKKPHGILAQEVDLVSGKCIGEAKILASIKEGFSVKSRIFVEQGKDGKPNKMILTIRKKPDNRNDALNNEAFDIHVFDNNLELLKQGIIRMPYTEQKMDNGDFFLDKENNLFLLSQVREDGKLNDYKKDGKEQYINFHYELLKLNLGNSTVESMEIKLDNKYINIDIPFIKGDENVISKLMNATRNKLIFNESYVGSDGLIRLAGFYSDPQTGIGVFSFTINHETKKVDKKWHRLQTSLLNRYEKEGVELKKNEEVFVTLKEIRILEDNSVFVIGEKIYHQSKKVVTNNEPSETYDYQDLFIAKIDPNGELEWTNRIPKRGGYYEPNGAGSIIGRDYLMIDENTAYFFGIDNSSNINLEEDKIPNKYSQGGHSYMLFKIDLNDGSFEKEVVLRPKRKDGRVFSKITDVYTVAKDELILMRSSYDGTNTLIRVTITD